MELKANPNRQARGLVIEAKLDKGRGPVATVSWYRKVRCMSEIHRSRFCFGKVRAMMDDKGRRVKEAGPSTPVEILGLNDVPNAGEIFIAPEMKKRQETLQRHLSQSKRKDCWKIQRSKLSLDDLFPRSRLET